MSLEVCIIVHSLNCKIIVHTYTKQLYDLHLKRVRVGTVPYNFLENYYKMCKSSSEWHFVQKLYSFKFKMCREFHPRIYIINHAQSMTCWRFNVYNGGTGPGVSMKITTKCVKLLWKLLIFMIIWIVWENFIWQIINKCFRMLFSLYVSFFASFVASYV